MPDNAPSPAPSRKPYPGFWQAGLLELIYLALVIGALIPVGIVDVAFKAHLASHPIVTASVQLLAFGLLLLIARRLGGVSIAEWVPTRRVSGQAVVGAIISIPGLFILDSQIGEWVLWLLPMPGWLEHLFEGIVGGRANLLYFVILGPITEEILFRGIMMRGFTLRYGVWRAIALSTLWFALFHANPWQFTTAVMPGLLLAWWYSRTRSLILCILGHVTNNAIATSLGLGLSGLLPALHPVVSNAAGLVMLAAGCWVVHRSTPEPQVETVPSSARVAA